MPYVQELRQRDSDDEWYYSVCEDGQEPLCVEVVVSSRLAREAKGSLGVTPQDGERRARSWARDRAYYMGRLAIAAERARRATTEDR